MGKAVIEIVCEVCGAKSTRRKDNVDSAKKKFGHVVCSISCATSLRAKNPKREKTTIEFIKSCAAQRSTGCLEWQKSKDKYGYGRVSCRDLFGRRPALAHRVMYTLVFGKIPDGMCVCHSCDNRLCIEPTHLWLGTISENNMDMVKKGRNVTRKKGDSKKHSSKSVKQT